jgi:hypothetical protein
MTLETNKLIHRLPIIPADVLKKFHVHEPLDGRFRAAARLLQALWREDHNLPIGTYVNEDGKRSKLGSRVTEAAGNAGGNYLTPEIAQITRREIAYREIGALIDEDRLATNLLSSMPLTFNLFAPFVHKHENATATLRKLIPDFDGVAVQTLFEHSPGRGDPKFTHDYTAFDALFRYTRGDGKKGFVAIEVKYSESMREPVAKLRPRYDELSQTSELFIDPADPALRANPLQQFWREHLLAQAMLDAGHYDEGFFVVIAPKLNYHVQKAADAYRTHLREAGSNKACFIGLTLEEVIDAIRESEAAQADALHERYCNFWRVDRELESSLQQIGAPKKPITHLRENEASPESIPKARKGPVTKGKAKASKAA